MKKWILPIAVCALVLGFSETAQAHPPRVVGGVGVSNFGGFYQPSVGVNYATRVGNNGVLSIGYGAPVYNYGHNYGVTQFGIPGYSYRSFYSTPYVVPTYGVPVYPGYGGFRSGGIIIR